MGGHPNESDLFSELFGRQQQRGGGGYQQGFQARGPDVRYNLEIAFMDAVKGQKRSLTMPDGKGIEVAIPAGLRDGQTLRLRGKGGPGIGQGKAGDAYVTVSIAPHPIFMRDGNDIEIELPITFDEAVLGAKVEVPTISGAVSMTIPKGASSGHRLRLKGKGVATSKGSSGDQFVRLKIVLPDKIDEDMEKIALNWRDKADFDPRAQLRREA
jgi:DnaJ-class molecular chaperone